MKWIDEGTANPLETNAALFSAALNEFASHSYKDASLNRILKAAGMNKGSFYYRFHDKLELYLSLLMRIGGEKAALFEQYGGQIEQQGFFEEFRQKALLGLRFAKSEPNYHALFQRVLEEKSDIRAAIDACFGGTMENMMEQMITRAKAAGELRGDLPAETTARVIATLMNKIDTVISPDLEDKS